MEPLTEGARRVLVAARMLIETKGWTQGKSAEAHSGEAVSALDPAAWRFCATGALARAAGSVGVHLGGNPDWLAAHARLTAVARKIGGTRIIDACYAIQNYNDTIAATKADILALFDAALEETP